MENLAQLYLERARREADAGRAAGECSRMRDEFERHGVWAIDAQDRGRANTRIAATR